MSPRRRAVDAAQARNAGDAVSRFIWADLQMRPAARVALYAALRDESPVYPLLERLRAHGRVALLPRIRGAQLEFARFGSWRELRPGAYGVLQPPPSVMATALGAADVVLVPGLAFDRAGHRLGRGGGFYDRTFRFAQAGPLRIGVAYTFQICTDVPHGSQDRAVDAIVTECGMLWPRGRR